MLISEFNNSIIIRRDIIIFNDCKYFINKHCLSLYFYFPFRFHITICNALVHSSDKDTKRQNNTLRLTVELQFIHNLSLFIRFSDKNANNVLLIYFLIFCLRDPHTKYVGRHETLNEQNKRQLNQLILCNVSEEALLLDIKKKFYCYWVYHTIDNNDLNTHL